MNLNPAIALATVFFLSSSWTSNAADVAMPNRPADEKECAGKNGIWTYYPMGKFYFCSFKTTDMGKSCTDNTQCQGDCIPEERTERKDREIQGRCASYLPTPGGCPVYMKDGKIIQEPCI
jgi:hypothetical protein